MKITRRFCSWAGESSPFLFLFLQFLCPRSKFHAALVCQLHYFLMHYQTYSAKALSMPWEWAYNDDSNSTAHPMLKSYPGSYSLLMLLTHSIPNFAGPNSQMVWGIVELILYLCPHFLMAWLIRTYAEKLKNQLMFGELQLKFEWKPALAQQDLL